MYAPWHHGVSAHRKAKRPPRLPVHPAPPPTHPSPHHTDSTPPTPRRLRALRHHQWPARHRAPDKNVRPNGRHNDSNHNTTRRQGSRGTGRHLPGAEPCRAPQIRGRWAPDSSNPLAPHTRTWSLPRAPQEARLRNPKHHPERPHTVTSRLPAGKQRHRPTRSPTHAMAHLTGRRRAQHTRRPKTPPRRHVPLPRPTPRAPGPPTTCTPTPTTPPRGEICRLRRRPAQRPRGTCRPQHKPNRPPSGTTPHQPGRRYGPQNRHLPVARPPTRTQVQTRHKPPSRLTPGGPPAREAGPGHRPCRKATPERRRDRRTTQPRRPHHQPSQHARSPRWTRSKWGDPHSGQKHHRQQGNLAREWTSRQYSMPTHRAWRHTEAARHRLLANLVRNLKSQCRTSGMRPASTHHQPMGHNPQVARAPPPWRTRRIRPTQPRRGRRGRGGHLKPARSERPGKSHPTRPSARPAGKRRPADTTATKTLSMPSWNPA